MYLLQNSSYQNKYLPLVKLRNIVNEEIYINKNKNKFLKMSLGK